MIKYITVYILLLFPLAAFPEVRLPVLFADNMVLQQNSNVPFWGWSEPNAKITISCSWDNELYTTIADKNAKWKTNVKTPAAGGPYTVTIREKNTLILHHVMIGEVWLLSGQSNMEWTANSGINNKEEEIKNSDHPLIHHIRISKAQSEYPQEKTDGNWQVCSPETMPGFSAVGYFFARELTQKLNIPVGLIHSSWGGSAIEAWIPKEVIEADSEFSKWKELYPDNYLWPYKPGSTYNAMIHPLLPFKIAGVLWYQGESNTGNPITYRRLLPSMIERWRNDWGYEFPFYFVQLAPFSYGRPLQGSLVQEAQLHTMKKTYNTGMAVITDIGDINDIHPRNKQDVGKRLAWWALHKTYNHTISYSGPIYQSMSKEGHKIKISFSHTEGGLELKNVKPETFKIAGDNRQFVTAQVEIDNGDLWISSELIPDPIAVRYGFSNTGEAALFNTAGLPASPFRTDDWPIIYSDVAIKSVYDPSQQGFMVTIEGTADKIVYSIDGTEPGFSSTIYNGPFLVKQKTNIIAKGISGNTLSETTAAKEVLLSKATYRPISFITYPKNNSGNTYTLINGQRGNTSNPNDSEWQIWEGESMEVVVDLGEVQKIRKVSIGFLQHQLAKVFLPSNTEISVSANNKIFIDIYKQSVPTTNSAMNELFVQTATTNTSGRYIKIKAQNIGIIPLWHTSAGSKALLMADEILVE